MALPLLAPLVVALLCLGLAALLVVLTEAAIAVLKNAPAIGPWLVGKAEAIEQAISHALGVAFSGIDHLIGTSIHLLARYIDKAIGELRSHAHLVAEVAATLVPLAHAIRAVGNLAHSLTKVWTGIEHGVRDLTRRWHGIERRVKAIERELARGIGHDLRVEVAGLRREVFKVEKPALEALREAEATAQAAIDDLYEWAKGKASLIGVGTFATAIATAIGLEAWNLLRCSLFRGLWSKRGCGLWQGLDDLLGLLVDAVLLVDFCALLPELETLFGELEAPLVELVASAADAACAHPPQGWVELAAPPLSLPAVYYTGPVPGN